MATVENDVAGLSDRGLQKRVKQARRDFEKLGDAQPSAENLKRMQATADLIVAGEKELRGREAHRIVVGGAGRRLREREERARRQERAATREALSILATKSGISGTFRIENLTEQEGAALLNLARRKYGRESQREELDSLAERRFEELVCKAVADPDLFERPRREAELRAKQAALAEQERRASLPERTYTGRGLIALPGLLGEWLRDQTEGSLDFEKLGTLAGVMLGLENRLPTLVGARIEDVDGEPVMVAPAEPLRFDRRDGSRAVTEAVTYLSKNRLLRVERGPDGLQIGAGERVKKLHEEGGDNDGG